MSEWISENWILVVVPLSIFLAFCIIGLWARRVLYDYLHRKLLKTGWGGTDVLIRTTRGPLFFWFILFGSYVAVESSSIQSDTKALAGKIIASIFIISIIWLLIILIERLLRLYLSEIKSPRPSEKYVIYAIRVALLVIGILILADFWGWPVTPVILLLAALILVAVVTARDAILNIFSGFEIAGTRMVQVGDFIKLGSGDEGYVVDTDWMTVKIRTPDQNDIVIPNSKLIRDTLINYGRPLKRAAEPFHFYTRLHLKELTGLRAANLTELVAQLKTVPDSVIYYHTHAFLEEYQYLNPEPANEFAFWVEEALDNPVLSEKLANIDIFAYPSLGSLKSAIVALLEQYMEENPELALLQGTREFHFIKSTSIILPTPYIVYDLREFVEVLRKITINSLYFHIFESRLRLQKRSNDFSVWIRDSFGDDELAAKIDNLVPYTTTIETLRSEIIQHIEKRIK